MELFETIYKRRSIRKFTADKINEDDIDKILKVAMYAPSAGNAQPWHFIVIDDREILEDLSQIIPNGKMIAESSHCIVVCADTEQEKYKGRWMLDCSAATQNMLLAATSLSIGSVWIGIFPENERMDNLSKYFNLSDNIKPVSIVALGYPAENKVLPDRFKAERIHRNKY